MVTAHLMMIVKQISTIDWILGSNENRFWGAPIEFKTSTIQIETMLKLIISCLLKYWVEFMYSEIFVWGV